MSTLLVNTLTATISRLKLQLGEKDNIIGKLREGQKASPAAILAAPVTMGVLPAYEMLDMACQVDMMGEALEERDHNRNVVMHSQANTIQQKDLVISKLQQELDNLSTNGQLQLEQSEWLNSIVQEKENVIALQRDHIDRT